VPHAAVVFAVEKNPGAVQYLRAKFAQSPKVCIIASDMRSLALDAPVDIVVSELLGSFGCNELSPECIVGLFRNNPSVVAPHTISIPAAYTSQIAPVCSAKLHQAAVQQALYPDPLRGPLAVNGLVKAMETPYVVRPCAAAQMHEAMDCWSFQHAGATTGEQSMEDDSQYGMERFVELKFSDFHRPAIVAEGNGYGPIDDAVNKFLPVTAPHPPSSDDDDDDDGLAVPWLCTGLLGSFTSQLYGSVVMSIEPHHFSKGMFSWFPLYFPLQEPILVPIGASLKVHVWRKHDAQSVWYEWCVQAYCQREDGTVQIHATSPIHNAGGRSYRVSLIA
jgi:type II protein arginine methyltransferase